MQNMTYVNVLKKVEHQQAVIDALRKENILLRAKLEIKITKINNLKTTLRKLATGL